MAQLLGVLAVVGILAVTVLLVAAERRDATLHGHPMRGWVIAVCAATGFVVIVAAGYFN